MRRIKQALSEQDCITVLKRNEFGVLCLKPDDAFPYGVPLNYSYVGGKLLLHGSDVGYKLDAIRHDPHVCFTTIDTALEDYDAYSTFFRSVIVFGQAHIPETREEKIAFVTAFAEKLSPGNPRLQAWLDRDIPHMTVIVIEIDHMTGKESIEYVRDSQPLRRDKPERPQRNTVKE